MDFFLFYLKGHIWNTVLNHTAPHLVGSPPPSVTLTLVNAQSLPLFFLPQHQGMSALLTAEAEIKREHNP